MCSDDGARLDERDLAAARLVHRRVAVAAGLAPAASTWRESSARWPGSGGVSTSIAVAAARRAALAALAGADDRDGAALVEAQQLREPQLEPGGDPRRDRERRARLAALDLATASAR